MEGRAMPPQANVTAVEDTQENGEGQSCISPFVMVWKESLKSLGDTSATMCLLLFYNIPEASIYKVSVCLTDSFPTLHRNWVIESDGEFKMNRKH